MISRTSIEALSREIPPGPKAESLLLFVSSAKGLIRNDASTEAGIIGSLNEGDEVQILDVLQSADGYAWYYIQLDNGATGYVRSDLIEADDSELAAFRDKGQEETEDTAEEEPAEAYLRILCIFYLSLFSLFY